MLHQLHQFRRWAGVDRAVFFSNAAQVTRLVTGPLTMLLWLKFLTPEIQGYFYAFAGVVATQVFLEMGFSQNILQFASHEFAKLHFTAAQTVAGDPVAKSRLISLGRLAFGYYAVAAVIVLLGVGIGGHVFFSISGDPGMHWQGAWWLIAVTAALALAVNPAWALLNGCNQVAVVAKFNFWAALAGFAVNAIALISGAGIYASALGALFSLLLSVGYLVVRWRSFFRQFLERPQHGEVSWAREIWPFQWRIAVSWMSGYFVFDIINPIAFQFCGPVAAGQLGMSLQIIRMISNVALTWIYTKAPRFGMLIAARAWSELDTLWRRSTLQVFVISSLGLAAFLAAILFIGQAQPKSLAAIPFIGLLLSKVPARLASFEVNAWLAGATVIQVLTGCLYMELRAHKREPLMWISVANAVLSMVFILPLVWVWGITGEAVGYALGIWILFIPAFKIYCVKRLEYRQAADHFHAPPAPALDPDLAAGGFS
jgi:O-antigen/teichoic acid export membrane protein